MSALFMFRYINILSLTQIDRVMYINIMLVPTYVLKQKRTVRGNDKTNLLILCYETINRRQKFAS